MVNQCVLRPRCRRVRRRNRPAVSYPPYVCQSVLAFSSNFFGSITHRGGRDARVPVRAASRLLYWYNHFAGKAPSLTLYECDLRSCAITNIIFIALIS
ncbi:MAG: hypothetical protein LBQ66_01120 [Planctomycetaceae bacterium]|nr:hypothetical protein [Planctomycetaceae bacterium]